MAPELPAILGNGVGGLVAATGAGVDAGMRGTRVITTAGGAGGYAERAAVPAEGLIAVPTASGSPTRRRCSPTGARRPGSSATPVWGRGTVLVEAAGGGVGTPLVQLAHNAGADVIATAGGPAELELATELRATAAVDYTAPDWPEQVREASDGGVDVVLDGVGGAPGEAAFGLLNAGGRFVPYGMVSGAFAAIDADEDRRRRHQRRPRRAARARGEPRAHRGGARRGGGRPAAGRGAELPRGRAADAHVAIEARATIGKTLLRVVNLRGDR